MPEAGSCGITSVVCTQTPNPHWLSRHRQKQAVPAAASPPCPVVLWCFHPIQHRDSLSCAGESLGAVFNVWRSHARQMGRLRLILQKVLGRHMERAFYGWR